MVLPLIIYRITARIHTYLNVIFTIFGQQIDIHDNTKNIPHFIWDIFQQLFTILYTNDISIVIGSNIYLAALSICKTTDPFQILITSGFFPFCVLVFFHFMIPPILPLTFATYPLLFASSPFNQCPSLISLITNTLYIIILHKRNLRYR